jgi:flagellar M-ring protein FliF
MRGPGSIRRLTVAVLVNDLTTTDAAGATTTVPRSTEELDSLRDLVASAVGFDESRGDVITVKSMSFEAAVAQGTEAVGPVSSPLDLMSLIQLGLLAVVALVLGLFVLRPILRQTRPSPALLPPGPDQLSSPGVPMVRPALAGVGPSVDSTLLQAEIVDPVTRLRRLIEERQDETAQILQNWIEDPAEKERA